MPFEEQAARWKEQDRYFYILSKCDDAINLNKHFKAGCYHERNRCDVEKMSIAFGLDHLFKTSCIIKVHANA